MSNAWFLQHLACPDCARDLDAGAACACGFEARGRDFRPQRPRPRTMTFDVVSPDASALRDVVLTRPARTYQGPPPIRDSNELFSAVAARLAPDATLLDLGCGPRDQAIAAQHFGARYAGIDYASDEADLLADAHAIPFRAATFDFVLAYAVVEHLSNPFLAMREVARVLKPGGVFFGAVSQGEPFHDSYLHHTALGVLSVFGAAGLRLERLWPSYDTLHALSGMGRYPKAQRLLIESVYRIGKALPILAPRRFFGWTEREKQLDELHRAASLCFIATNGAA